MKLFSEITIISVLFLLLFPIESWANGKNTVTETEARQAAVFQVILDRSSSEKSTWKNKTIYIQEPIKIYDASDSLYSYLFNLTSGGEPVGFIEVSAYKNEFPILSFARSGENMSSKQIQAIMQNGSDKVAINEKFVVIGPSYFGIKEDYDDGTAELYTQNEKIIISKANNAIKPKKVYRENKDARDLWEEINESISIFTSIA